VVNDQNSVEIEVLIIRKGKQISHLPTHWSTMVRFCSAMTLLLAGVAVAAAANAERELKKGKKRKGTKKGKKGKVAKSGNADSDNSSADPTPTDPTSTNPTPTDPPSKDVHDWNTYARLKQAWWSWPFKKWFWYMILKTYDGSTSQSWHQPYMLILKYQYIWLWSKSFPA